MPNWPVRVQRDLRIMERHFPIKSGEPIEMAVVILNFVTEFPNKGLSKMEGRISVGIFRPKYVDHLQNIPVRRNRNESCYLNFDRNFRNLWHNGNWRKIALVTECAHCFMGLWFSNVRYIEKHPSRCVLWLESKLVYVICRHQTNFGSSRLRYKSIDCLPVEIFTRKRRWWEVCGTSFEDFRPRSTWNFNHELGHSTEIEPALSFVKRCQLIVFIMGT